MTRAVRLSADSRTGWLRFWSRYERATVLLVFVVGVVPTLVYGMRGAGYLSDDYWMAMVLDRAGVWDGMWSIAFDAPGRPAAGPYYAFLYQLIGERPAVQVLILMATNIALLDSLRRFGRDFLPPHLLLPSLLVFAALANHGSTRLWFVVGSYPLAAALVLYAGRLVVMGRVAVPSALVALALLLYEGVAGLGVVVVALVVWRFPERRRSALILGATTCAVGAFTYFNSPRLPLQRGGTYPGPFENASSLVPAQIGAGVAPSGRVAMLVSTVVIAWCIVLFVCMVWPSLSVPSEPGVLASGGVALMIIGAGPMLVGGSVFATAGVNDRNNLIPAIGTAMVFGSIAAAIGSTSPRASIGLLVVAIAGSTTLSIEDVDSYRDSVLGARPIENGIAAVIEDPSDYLGTTVLVMPDVRPVAGVGAFIESNDIQGALRLHQGGDWSFLRVHPSEGCGARGAVFVLDWRLRTIERTRGAALC